ncbi:polysaccharide deacetylase family protein [Spirosoma endophyticum]|uniref:Peptidoglycan/xylan/chitin deacetylase, PgdA/CDA1 family n=1 Tax=Spirosoma endophyticum TaxID=662367 RepID=A0A1I1W8D6_9BACT|nr:polysaccharide deacetylase family protein [Spirosoma endophyticum]SFD89270.1 Peptidoglycan/xylan/chitin deacetylase, PgdA/CDA1 family [Spirosoma endophyticum]
MTSSIRQLSILFSFLTLCFSLISKAQPIQWPNGAKAAICLTYDDGMSSQLEQAVPLLTSLQLPGTFFLNSVATAQTADQWREAARHGHELANHTLFHPCLGAKGWKPAWALENYTFDRILKEVQSMNTQLYLLDGKSTKRTFAFPCTETTAGGVSYVDTLRQSGLVSYGRMGGSSTDAIVTNFATLDSLLVPSWAVQPTNTANDLIAYAEKAAQQGGLGVYMFHGVGSQWIAVSASEHRKLVEHLAKNKKTYWVTTFQEAMSYVTKWQKNHPSASIRK